MGKKKKNSLSKQETFLSFIWSFHLRGECNYIGGEGRVEGLHLEHQIIVLQRVPRGRLFGFILNTLCDFYWWAHCTPGPWWPPSSSELSL